MTEEHVPPTPDEELAAMIVTEFIQQRLIVPAHADDVLRQLADGTAKVEDWNHWAELAIESEVPEQAHVED